MASQHVEGAESLNNGESAVHNATEVGERNASVSPDRNLIAPQNNCLEVPVISTSHTAPLEEVHMSKTIAGENMNSNQDSVAPPNATCLGAASTVSVVENDTDSVSLPSTTENVQSGNVKQDASNAPQSLSPLEPNDGSIASGDETSHVEGRTEDNPLVGTCSATDAIPCELTSTPDSGSDALKNPMVESDIGAKEEVESVSVATADSTVTIDVPADSSALVDAEFKAPVVNDSVVMEAKTDHLAESVALSEDPKVGTEPPLEELTRTASKLDEDLPPEIDSIEVPIHWHPKPCVHVSSIGGTLTEEEILSLFNNYGQVSSVTFENERHDAAIVRYEHQADAGDELLPQVREATNNTKLGEKTLIVEPFRPDSLLFVGNLTPGIDDTGLEEMFKPHGRIERAFVLKNAEGHSKCYGFVEYSLKSQAITAKSLMGNINMDGRVLRVEWSDCRKVEDMFSTVLFIDRIPREGPHIEVSLKNLFSKYGKIRDSHLAIGSGNQMRGFGFIDFYHSQSADKAHQALDGHLFEGSNIRVSYANPSKSAQSYKFRYSSQGGQGPMGRPGSGMLMGPPPRGSSRGPSPRMPAPMPLLPSRFMNPGRQGMLGFGLGMQFGRGPFDRGNVPFHGSGRGMLGPNSFGGRPFMLGNMPPRAGMAVVENNVQKLPFGQGPVSITQSAIVQVATAQARAREEEAKARAEAARQGVSRSYSGGDSMSVNQYQRFQHLQHQSPMQHQMSSYDQHHKQGDMYMHQQSQQTAVHSQQQHAWNQGQQNVAYQRVPYHGHQSFSQQQHMDHTAQNDAYYQQASQHTQQHGYAPQQAYHYNQQQGYQYNQQATQVYGQAAQQAGDHYQQSAQQSQAAYSQQNYGEQYAQQQASQQTYNVPPSYDASASAEAAQQQAYAAYYQQQVQAQTQAQAQAQAQATTNAQAGGATSVAGTTSAAQQSYEAQWAAYYASQAAYQQQQTSGAEVGQKRPADQMDSQNQAVYNYAGYSQQGSAAGYQQQQQQVSDSAAYQAQAATAAAYQQQPTYTSPAYQQQGAASVSATYQQPGATPGYDQSSTPAAEGTFHQSATAFQPPSGVYDYSKRPRF
ncbi:hypothetical protein KP509_03G030500 [Ceratopteris richardii]|uniref:RRM domain-containing protein n=1 Tax=Ceratopteris richardii TaxID=49495 RepID=A0A8T2VA54_CERRI|nr:hypothetical protein KP509_03G030500 [Ceratopteris richardii]